MKKILLVAALFLFVKADAQNTDYLLSVDGLGVIKLGMKQAELEKLLKKKFILPNARDTADSWQDSAWTTYRNIDIRLYFQRRYSNENNFEMELIEVRTSSPLVKTRSGVTRGTDRSKIIADYDRYYMQLHPDPDDRSRSIVRVTDHTTERELVFYLRNKKVIAMEAGVFFNDQE